MTSTSSTDPLCDSCNHHHVQGVKCQICGHVGRSQIFLKMQTRSQEQRSYRIRTFNASSEYQELWELGVAMRGLVGGVGPEALSTDPFELDNLEAVSRHSVGFVGDAAMSCARWRWVAVPGVPSPGGSSSLAQLAYVDAFGVVDVHRSAGRGRALLMHLLIDQVARAEENGIGLFGAAVGVPRERNYEWLLSKLNSCGFVPAGAAIAALLQSIPGCHKFTANLVYYYVDANTMKTLISTDSG